MPMAEAEIERLARLILDAGDAASPIPPITESAPDFGLDEAYRVAAAVTRLRIGRGERWRTELDGIPLAGLELALE